VQEYGSFAVASYYDSFPDLSDGEVLAMLGTCPIS
jgi:predicted phosphoribosyltransferase